MINEINLKQSLDSLLEEYHKNTLLNYSIVKPNLSTLSRRKILLVGSSGAGKTELINSLNLKRAYEFFSLMQVIDLNDFDYIVLFRNLNLVDNILGKNYCDLHKMEMYKYLIISKKYK